MSYTYLSTCWVTDDSIPHEKAPLFRAREWLSIVCDGSTQDG